MIDLTQASPWLQLPVVLAIALPLAGLASVGLLRLVDWLAAVLNGGSHG
ncbi:MULTISPECIES: hypothetical protein [unclassified Corynebacterium]|nr:MULTISPECIES: hypothetical protein [unclassified Corynebacterium]MCT1452635.1 hypothetical protein [Corynebacterium sp. p3-SID1145]MCT1461537.1 hypothetical protein [Corynebacterium sp. p3-SID1140]MDN8594541.1 hypothetical protein [Corynebacterium sp. P4_F2]WKK55613.1 hypothetical protein QYR03_10685 [Corynebacterium sp. P4-C1]WKK63023.1 hypothetical protein QYR04_09380 [Corynebacterium sp. P8-C1]